MSVVVLLAVFVSQIPAPAEARKHANQLAGPVEARVLRVIVGDTIVVRATIWPGQHIEVAVRVAGIDAPELRSRCKTDRDRAWRAKTLLYNLLSGTSVFLHDVRHGKYAGRVIARVRSGDGIMIADLLLANGLAQPSSFRRPTRARATSTCPLTAKLTAIP